MVKSKNKYVCHRVKADILGRSYEGIRYRYRGIFIECGGYFQGNTASCGKLLTRN
jgi:hypothetical protein